MSQNREPNKFVDFITKQDLKPHSLALSFNQVKEYRSMTGGIISLLLILAFIGIFFFKLADVYSYHHISTETTVNRQNFSGIDIFNLQPFLVFRFEEDGSYLSCEDQFQNGINVTIQFNSFYRYNNSLYQDPPSYMMAGCLGEIGFTFPDELKDFLIFGRSDFLYDTEGPDEYLYRRIGFNVNQCDLADGNCSEYKNNLYPFFYFSNNNVSLTTRNDSRIVTKMKQERGVQTQSTLKSGFPVRIKIYFAKVDVITDHSIYPEFVHSLWEKQKQNISSWIFDEQMEINPTYNIRPDYKQLLNIALKRSVYTYQHQRSFKKIDSALSEIFGLLGLLFLVHGLLYSGYNQWSYKQMRLREMGVPSSQKPNLLSFYKMSLKLLIVRVFCFCESGRKKKKEDENQTYSQDEQYLDYRRLLRKLEQNQTEKSHNNMSEGQLEEKSNQETKKGMLREPSINSEIQESLITKSDRANALDYRRHQSAVIFRANPQNQQK